MDAEVVIPLVGDIPSTAAADPPGPAPVLPPIVLKPHGRAVHSARAADRDSRDAYGADEPYIKGRKSIFSRLRQEICVYDWDDEDKAWASAISAGSDGVKVTAADLEDTFEALELAAFLEIKRQIGTCKSAKVRWSV